MGSVLVSHRMTEQYAVEITYSGHRRNPWLYHEQRMPIRPESKYFLFSRETQAAMVAALIADSSHNKFMISCFSNGFNNLRIRVRPMVVHTGMNSQPKYGKT